jgi:hypothetical protein
MVKTTDLWNVDDGSRAGRWHGPGLGRILVQSQVTTAVMVVVEEPTQMTRQAGLVEDHHVIQALASNGADHVFHIRALPGRAWGRQHWLDAHGLDLLDELLAEDPVPVAEQIAGHGALRKCLPQLVSRPFCRRMLRNSNMNDTPAVMCQHQKYV